MPKIFRRRSQKTGLPPGTPVYVGKRSPEKTQIAFIEYDKENVQKGNVEDVEECLQYIESPTNTWIKVVGLNQTEILEKLGTCFGLHPLSIEDILSVTQRPKIEDFGEHVLIIIKTVKYNEEQKELEMDQLSFVLGPNFVISIQERHGDIFNQILDRIEKGRGNIRRMGTDYLFYALLDAAIDNYFISIEKIGDEIENLEDELISDPTQETLHRIYGLKQDLILLRRLVWPLREVISQLERGRVSLIGDSLAIFFRDVYDHTVQVMETVETYRDMLSGMLDIYLSSVSNRMNEVMKILTIIATIFIPLTFIAGVYGMNFRFMPELEWDYGYPLVWGIMLVIGIVMVIFFWRKKWF
ncbi:MAG: magnesium/cobalt transporter CorA [Promethearchaeota archaeon]